jgi:hypothetical protein
MNNESINAWLNTPKNAIIFITLVLALLFFILRFSGADSYSGTGLSSRNINNRWTYKYSSLTGSVSGGFVAGDDNSQMIYRSNLREGNVEFELYDNAGNLLVTFSGNNTADTLAGFFKEGERYRVRAKVKRAKKGNFSFKME